MTLEERQQRAESDELSTTELPLFLLDNASTVDKIKEWNRRKVTPHADLAVKRDDMRVQVTNILQYTEILLYRIT